MKSWRLLTVILISLAAVCSGALARDSNLPSECSWSISADSENGKFTAVLRWSLDVTHCMLEVFEVDGQERTVSWKTVMPSKSFWVEIFVSNDGKYVVILDRPKKPTADAVEFYAQERGKIKGYSHAQVLELFEEITGEHHRSAIPGLGFFHSWEGATHFCCLICQSKEFHWLVWNAASGEQIEVDEQLVTRISDHARQQFRKQLRERPNSYKTILACLFLSKSKRPEDRVLIERLLVDEHFVTNPMWTEKESFLQRALEQFNIHIGGRPELDYFSAESGMRRLADRTLAQWDGEIAAKSWGMSDYPYYYLGNVSVEVILRAKPKKRENLCVYLIPESVHRAEWDKKRPIHYLFADFDGFEPDFVIRRTVPCIFQGVTPGKYWVKAVWDKEKPFYDWEDEFYKPEKGDYENLVSPVIEVKAGQSVDMGRIQCEQKAKDK